MNRGLLRRGLTGCGLVAVLLFVGSCSKKKVRLALDGRSDYVLVAKESDSMQAQRFQKHFAALTGDTLRIVSNAESDTDRITLSISSELPEQAIAISVQPGNIAISGGGDEALQNAVFEFFERFVGVRWFAPDAALFRVGATIELEPVDYSYEPPITTRTVHSRLFYDNPEFADWHKVTHEAFPKYVPEARVHTFHRFMPEERFYEDHPEYYALRGDERLPTQLCLSNDTVLRIVKDSVMALFKRYPGASVLSVSQDDNQQYCQCPRCSKVDAEEGGPSGSMIRFVNKVAEAFPEKVISTLAYQHTRKPCKTKPLSNVLITLCSIECDRSAPIAKKCTEFANDLEGWAQLSDNVRIWDYTTQFTNFLAPFPNLHTLQPNIALFKDNNARWVFEQHSHNPSELFELRSYLLAKLLWNPDQDWQALVDEFCEGYYGEAGTYVSSYVKSIHANLLKDEDFFLFLYGDPSQAFGSYLSPENLKEYTQQFDEGEKVVAHDPVLLNRVKKARLGVDYAVLEAYRKNISSDYQIMQLDSTGQKSIAPGLTRLLDGFLKTCGDNKIELMNEMGFTVGEYGANYVSAIKTASRPNKAKGKKVTTITRPKKYANEDPNVLTDGALGGSSFYANWLGYEGDDMEVVVDLGQVETISQISMTFLQVTNHVVFFPGEVSFSVSVDGTSYQRVARIKNASPLDKDSKVNDLQAFETKFDRAVARYVKVHATNVMTPYWHHAAGLPSWVFADEIIID